MEKQNFAWPVTSMDQADYDVFSRWFDQNADALTSRQLIIWGAGIRGTIFSILLRERGVHNIKFVDSNPQKQGGYIDEFPIIAPEDLEVLRDQEEILILISTENSQDIQLDLESKGYQKNFDYFLVDAGQYSAYVAEFLRPYQCNALIMGDCEFSTMSLNEEDQNTLQQKLFQRLGKDNVKILAMHGIGLRAQYNILKAQIAKGMKPERAVIMINFETLTGMQHLLPRSQHTELLKMLLDVQENPSDEFRQYVQISEERSKNLQMEFFTSPEENQPVTDVRARNYFRLNYLYNLDIKTEGIEYLLKILELTSVEGIAVLPFIPPVNYEYARKLFGESFDEKYGRNVEKVRAQVENAGFRLLDLSYALDASLFSTPTTVTETSNGRGREKVADLLYAAIQEMK
ncbi:MAG: hypothetical protein HDR27_00020 [Lachnospiraceae bacterium]|nr:hypothetical protein [Lachnospiraceae bacterium]